TRPMTSLGCSVHASERISRMTAVTGTPGFRSLSFATGLNSPARAGRFRGSRRYMTAGTPSVAANAAPSPWVAHLRKDRRPESLGARGEFACGCMMKRPEQDARAGWVHHTSAAAQPQAAHGSAAPTAASTFFLAVAIGPGTVAPAARACP